MGDGASHVSKDVLMSLLTGFEMLDIMREIPRPAEHVA